MALITEDNKHIYYRALHSRVLIAYVANHAPPAAERAGDWKAYIFPVPGKSHEDEIYLWSTEGVALTEEEARALWPALAETFTKEGLRWRK